MAVGLCCSLVPVGVVALIAWLARGKAEDALKETRMLRAQLELLRMHVSELQKQLREAPPQVPTALPQPTPVEVPEPPVTAPTGWVAEPVETPAPEVAAPPPSTAEATTAPLGTPAVVRAPPPPEPPPAAPVPPRAPPPPPRPPIEWEKWIGIRGAAVLGGIVFAMAGVYLFRYSVQQGWISPMVRVATAMFAGLGGLIAGQRLRQRYPITAHALSGGGVVVLYAATWAAKALYDLIPLPLAFVLMVLVTAVAGVLAVRQNNRLVAYLGLVGGFATPLLLSTGQNAPVPLFAYILLLDLGLLFVAARTRWRSVAALALVGTTLLELGWIFTRMEAGQAPIAFTVLGLFSLLFAAMTLRGLGDAPMSTGLRLVLAGALFSPVLALAYFAAGDLDIAQLPTAGFLLVLTLGVGFIHRRAARGEPQLLLAASFASLAVLGLFATRDGDELTWRLLGSVLAVGVGVLVNALWPQPEDRRAGTRSAARAFLGIAGPVLLLAALRTEGDSHLSFNVGLGLTTLGLAWLSRDDAEPAWAWLFGVMPALWLAIDVGAADAHRALFSPYADAANTLGPPGVLAAALLAMTLFARVERVLLGFTIGTLTWCLLFSAFAPAQPLPLLAGLAVIAAIGLVTAVRSNHPVGAFVLVLLYGLRLAAPLQAEPGALVPWAGVVLLGSVVALAFHAVLLFAPARFHTHRFGALALGLVLPAAFPGLLLAWRQAWGPSMQGALPVGLAAVAFFSTRLVRPVPNDRRVMWLLAGAATLLAIAVPLQLENQWVTLSWALMGLGYAALWKRFDSRGLKWLAATLLTIVSIRLLLNPEVLSYAHPSGVPLINWITYTYLVPAACLVLVGWLLQPLEVDRARGWEAPFYGPKIPWVASSSIIAAALVVFAWVTLSVIDFYSDRSATSLTLSMDRVPARDLTLSVGWIIYSVGLLAFGMWRRSAPLRWMSLGFLLVSIGKVFLYDLGELKDLYRVASLMGLAISLIGISLAYQRFVFRRSEENPS